MGQRYRESTGTVLKEGRWSATACCDVTLCGILWHGSQLSQFRTSKHLRVTARHSGSSMYSLRTVGHNALTGWRAFGLMASQDLASGRRCHRRWKRVRSSGRPPNCCGSASRFLIHLQSSTTGCQMDFGIEVSRKVCSNTFVQLNPVS